MRNLVVLQGRGRISRNISSLAHSPQKSSCHGLVYSFAVRLFVNDSKAFGVNAHEQLSNTLSRKARLDVNNDAAIHHLTMRYVVQLAISPQPKRRSSMRHFIFIPPPGEPTESEGRCFRYVTLFDASIDSYKRYRSNDLASESVSAGLLADQFQRDCGRA